MPSRVMEAWAPRNEVEVQNNEAGAEIETQEEEEELEVTKQEWFAQVSALKQKQLYVERHLRLGLDSVKNKLSEKNYDVQQLTSASDKSAFSKLRGEIDDGLGRVRSSLKYLQNLLSAPATNETYVSTLANQMDACETEIESLKIQQNQDYERLNRVEVLLTREIEAFQRRIEGTAWEAPSSSVTAPSNNKQGRSQPHTSGRKTTTTGKDLSKSLGGVRSSRGDLLPEVIELEEYEKMYGQTGGWSEDEHKDFLRLFQRSGQSYTRVLSVCMAQMPHLSRQEIVEHCKWDAEHKNLLMRRRQAIQAWRERKNMQKEAEKKRRAEEFKNLEVDASEKELRQMLAAKKAEDERKRKALAEWKTEKKLQEEQERRRQARAQARQKERKEAEAREKRESAAAKLREYQKKKRLEMELMKLKERAERQEKQRKKVTSVDLIHLWERDKIFLQQRKDLCMREELERREVEDRKKKIVSASAFQVQAERDPQRLLQATEALLHRGATPREKKVGLKQDNYIRNVTHLAVPSWRQNLPRGFG